MNKKTIAEKIISRFESSGLKIIYDTSTLGYIHFSVDGISSWLSVSSRTGIKEGVIRLAEFVTADSKRKNKYCVKLISDSKR